MLYNDEQYELQETKTSRSNPDILVRMAEGYARRPYTPDDYPARVCSVFGEP